jgi:hypothetical protein
VRTLECAGVRNSYCAPPPLKCLILNDLFLALLMILGQQKIHSPGALAPGGERPSTGLVIPPPTDGLWSFCWPPPAKGLAPEWVVRGGLGGMEDSTFDFRRCGRQTPLCGNGFTELRKAGVAGVRRDAQDASRDAWAAMQQNPNAAIQHYSAVLPGFPLICFFSLSRAYSRGHN